MARPRKVPIATATPWRGAAPPEAPSSEDTIGEPYKGAIKIECVRGTDPVFPGWYPCTLTIDARPPLVAILWMSSNGSLFTSTCIVFRSPATIPGHKAKGTAPPNYALLTIALRPDAASLVTLALTKEAMEALQKILKPEPVKAATT